jgi:hypothetical protein
LDKHERNYPVFLAEMQAAVFGMEQFHHFLITGRLTLYTDHRPLCKLSSCLQPASSGDDSTIMK